MKNKKYVSVLLLILLGCTIIGIVLEYARIKKTYHNYVSYETQVETGLIARLAKSYLEKNDLNGFKNFCRESNRYSLEKNKWRPYENDIVNIQESGKTEDQQKINTTTGIEVESIYTPPDQIGLQSRITLFDHKGKVLFDSWKDAYNMENHSDRPEFRLIMNSSGEKKPFYSFERYSTTIQKKMFFCITKFNVGESVYLLRSGNILQALNMAGSEYRQNLLVFLLFFIFTIFLLILIFYSKIRYYRDRLLEIGTGLKNGPIENELPSYEKRVMTVDWIIHSIQGEIDHRNGLLVKERLLRNVIFQSLVEGVVLLDNNGVILDMNDNARRLLDLKPKTGSGISIFGVWRNFDLEEIFKKGEWSESESSGIQKELNVELPSGTRRLDVRMRSVRWGESSSGCLLLLYDLTRVRRLENYRKEFVSNVSHEIKTPLTVIMGTAEALQEGALEDKEQTLKFLDTLDIHAKRLYALVQDVLSLSNLESEADLVSKESEPVSLLEPIEIAISLCDPLAKEKRIKIVFENKTVSDPVLPMNSQLMEQAFVNLIDNAVKYSADEIRSENHNEGHSLKSDANNSEALASIKKVILRLSNTEKMEIKIEIIDEGPGIPLKHQERIFERFYRVDKSRSHQTGGTGLGLAIVKHIVQLHRGTIYVKNNSVKGCTFTLLFPAPDKD